MREKAAKEWLRKLEGLDQEDINRAVNKVPDNEMSNIAKTFTCQLIEINKLKLLECYK